MKKIESKQNPQFKQWMKLLDKKGRQASGEFLVEGTLEISRALAAGYKLTGLGVVPEYLENASRKLQAQIYREHSALCFELSAACFDHVAVRQGSGGLLATFRAKDHSFEKNEQKKKAFRQAPLFLLIENGEKPGNLGALLRTASACGVSAVFVLGKGVDLYNPNVIRASLGALFGLEVVVCSRDEVIAFCAENQVQLFLASLEDRSKPHWQENFTNGCGFVLGNEATGLDKSWYDLGLPLVYVPMEGPMDSLNLSVSGALLLYEAKRQRVFKRKE